jgi:hypothetical protein
MKGRTRTQQPEPAAAVEAASLIHAQLTLADRDAIDPLMRRIAWQALLLQRTLATRDMDDDLIDDDDRAALETGLIELCEAIVRDTAAIRDVIDSAEKRGGPR